MQANNFAADLLIPDEQLKDELNKGDASIEGLAEKFRVSKDAIRFKLEKVILEDEK